MASLDLEHGIAIGIPRVKARKLWRRLADSISTQQDWWGLLPASSSFLCPNTKRPFIDPVLVLSTGVTVEASTFKPSSHQASSTCDDSLCELEALRLRVQQLECEVAELRNGCVPNLAMKSAVLEVRSLLKRTRLHLKPEGASDEVGDEGAMQLHVKSQLHAPSVDKERVGHLMRRMSSAFKQNTQDKVEVDKEMCSSEYMHSLKQNQSILSSGTTEARAGSALTDINHAIVDSPSEGTSSQLIDDFSGNEPSEKEDTKSKGSWLVNNDLSN